MSIDISIAFRVWSNVRKHSVEARYFQALQKFYEKQGHVRKVLKQLGMSMFLIWTTEPTYFCFSTSQKIIGTVALRERTRLTWSIKALVQEHLVVKTGTKAVQSSYGHSVEDKVKAEQSIHLELVRRKVSLNLGLQVF